MAPSGQSSVTVAVAWSATRSSPSATSPPGSCGTPCESRCSTTSSRPSPPLSGDWHSYTRSAMPTYEYRCDNGHTFEVMQRMSDDALISCSTCEAPVQRVFHPVAVHFKGSGFYNTDYGRKQSGDSSDSTAKSDSG